MVRFQGKYVVWKNVFSALSRLVPKRPVVLCFTNDGLSLVVGDKTGEAQRYSLEGPDWTTATGGHLLGHFSMLLDMVCWE